MQNVTFFCYGAILNVLARSGWIKISIIIINRSDTFVCVEKKGFFPHVVCNFCNAAQGG